MGGLRAVVRKGVGFGFSLSYLAAFTALSGRIAPCKDRFRGVDISKSAPFERSWEVL